MSEQTQNHTAPTPPEGQHQYSCSSCGAALEFAPGTTALACPYCGARTAITLVGSLKHDYATYLATAPQSLTGLDPFSLQCGNCGSMQSTTALSSRCPTCKGALVVSDDLGGRLKRPDGVVPFVITKDRASASFKDWAGSRWFAPNALKEVLHTDSMVGAYVPHWGFDDRTITDYAGRRGEHYWETETYTVSVNGQQETRTRQVQRTRWYPTSGRVWLDFVDVLAPAVRTPDARTLVKLGPWKASAATSFEPQLLAGFDTPRYTVTSEDGYAHARRQMVSQIESACRRDIGGDEQQLTTVRTTDTDVLFRLLLMPLWMATYIVGGRVFRVYVNANTGQVVGERPYSAVKIALLAVTIVAAIVAGLLIYHQ